MIFVVFVAPFQSLKYRIEEKQLRALARTGDVQAQYKLAIQYGRGEHVAQSWQEAFYWCQLAAAQGLSAAQNTFGYLYENGLGVEASPVAAAQWYQKAVDQELMEAYWNLCLMYDSGRGVPQNAGRGVLLAKAAAEQGHASAQCHLGMCALQGRGCLQSYPEAVSWFKLAADQNDVAAQWNLGLLLRDGNGGMPRRSSEAVYWFRRASDAGHLGASLALATALDVGVGTDVNLVEAVDLYQRVLAAGMHEAAWPLAECYQYGRGVARHPKRALALYQQALDQGDLRAQESLWQIAEDARLGQRGSEKNEQVARHLFALAAKAGSSKALGSLRLMDGPIAEAKGVSSVSRSPSVASGDICSAHQSCQSGPACRQPAAFDCRVCGFLCTTCQASRHAAGPAKHHPVQPLTVVTGALASAPMSQSSSVVKPFAALALQGGVKTALLPFLPHVATDTITIKRP